MNQNLIQKHLWRVLKRYSISESYLNLKCSLQIVGNDAPIYSKENLGKRNNICLEIIHYSKLLPTKIH